MPPGALLGRLVRAGDTVDKAVILHMLLGVIGSPTVALLLRTGAAVPDAILLRKLAGLGSCPLLADLVEVDDLAHAVIFARSPVKDEKS